VHQDERRDGLAVVDVEGKEWARKLAYGTDYVMQPVWHPAGTHIAYVTWNQPLMPWDGAELRLATLGYDRAGFPFVESTQTIAGDTDTSVFQPEFSPDGKSLAYTSDASGWWQLYVYDLETGRHTQLTSAEAEHAVPAWSQGIRMYAWSGDSRYIYSIRNQKAVSTLWCYDTQTGQVVAKPDDDAAANFDAYTDLRQIAVASTRDAVALLASASTIPERIISYDPERDTALVRRYSTSTALESTRLARTQAIEWSGHDGGVVHGLYYPPTSDHYEGIGLPPLIVHVHGGPTSQRRLGYDAEMQFYATRGYAVLQVNHRGSTGYGKAYKDKHRRAWGDYDVEDSASGASFLAAQGLADPQKFVILGGSAGGYTVLQSLVSKPGFYKAGVCLYGISNQFTLVSEADFKFEERYSETLLGTLPQDAPLYRERSPLFHADKIVDPVIVFQGEDDNVVPKSQSDSIVAALRQRGVPHEYHVYAGEGHGFRKPETIDAYLKATLKFLERYVVYA
jgi:dipeptidyl aminopeptidase/acylaminoacyl peptidase